MAFKEVSLASDKMTIQGLTGGVPLLEDLSLKDPNGISFRYLFDQDPFQKVDYLNIHPFLLKEKEPLTIQSVTIKNNTIGPLKLDASIYQNLFWLHQFDVLLFGGTASGKFHLNFHPAQLSLGLLARVSNVSPQKIVSLSGQKKRDADVDRGVINTRTTLKLNLNQSLLTGRTDITEIGGQQLIGLIDVLDPGYEDPDLNNARTALKLGYPRFVGIQFDQGFMDMTIDIDGLISKRLSIKSFPIGPFVRANTRDLARQLEKGPLR